MLCYWSGQSICSRHGIPTRLRAAGDLPIVAHMSTDCQSGSPDPCVRTLTDFLLRARRRRLAAGLLAAAIPAAILNEVFRWGGLGAARWLRWDVPILDVGPFVLLALVPVLCRQWSPLRWRAPSTTSCASVTA